MQVLGGVAKFLFGGGLLGGGLLGVGARAILGGGGSKKPQVLGQRPATRDDAMLAIERNDALRRRKGAAADLITGTRGAEAAAGSTGRLVLGS